MHDPFHNALVQLTRACNVQSFPRELIERLSLPEREIVAHISTQLDDGVTKIFKGYRVQHSSIRGPYKGGIRFHSDANLAEVRALAFWMTIKTAVVGLPLGGGKGGVVVDDTSLSHTELERLSRAWVRAFAPVIGPNSDVPAPDVNTTAEIMAWMADEYGHITGDTSGAAFTGKPVDYGGSEGRAIATARGGYEVFAHLQKSLQLPERVRVAVQGMGNVGGNAARIFAQEGHTVVAISDSKGAIYCENGIAIDSVEAHKRTHGTLATFPDVDHISNSQLLELDVDVLVPAALENQITEQNAEKINAKLILELANGPTTPQADDLLFNRNITVVPDVLANAGGVVVSYFELQQNRSREHWSEDDVLQRLKETLVVATDEVHEVAQTNSTDLRRAAFVVALTNLQETASNTE